MGLLGDMMYCNFILMYFILFISVVFFWFCFPLFFLRLICKTFLNVGRIKKVKEKNNMHVSSLKEWRSSGYFVCNLTKKLLIFYPKYTIFHQHGKYDVCFKIWLKPVLHMKPIFSNEDNYSLGLIDFFFFSY